MEIQTNEFQTKLTDEFINSLNPEIKDQLLDCINSIPFIQTLISPNRKRAKDLSRDSKGRIIVDITNPHILEDMDYFRPSALHFKKYGRFTNLRPNGNPNSEFYKWMQQELDRIWNGMVRESDGEWITGYFYFYLNYNPIIQTKIRKGTNQGDRVTDFPEIWEGSYLMFHYIDQARNGGLYNDFKGGQHCVEIAKRGASKSYSASSMMSRNFICGENKLASKKVRNVVVASEKEALIKDGTLNKFIETIDFCAEHTPFPRQRLKDSLADMHWIMGYKDAESNRNKGTKNEVQGVSTNFNPDKARGKRANLFVYEEFGKFPKFIDTWIINKPSVEEGGITFGEALAIGTGGTENSDFSGALEIIYSPIGYNVYAIPNVFDRNSQGKQMTVFFFGAYLNRKGFYNKDGVSDVIGALVELLTDRYKLKYNSSDPTMLTRAKAENPITIQEAIMRRESTIYPVADITDVLNEIDLDPRSLDYIWTGDLVLSKGKVSYKPNINKKPIREFPHKDNKLEGCIEIHQMPEYDSNDKVMRGRYIAGIDPYDDDVSDTLSLGSIYVLDLFTDQIVCEYTGRPYLADDFYEICRKILLFYDAECNYENNKKGLYKYFSQHNCTYLLSDTLEFLKEKESNPRQSYGNKSKGTQASAPIKSYARKCIRDWLLKPSLEIILNEQGEEVEITSMNLKKIRSRALLKELTLWNPDGNYDRHDALGMLMLLREEKLRLFGEDTPQNNLTYDKKSDLGNDSFFTENYDDKFNNNPKMLF